MLFHILAASLNSMVVSSINVEGGGIINYQYSCVVKNGIWRANVVIGSSCPTTSSGTSMTSFTCDKHDDSYNDAKASDDCSKVRTAQAFVVISCILYFFVLAGLLLRPAKINRNVFSALSFLCGILEMANLIMYEERSKDPDDGWSNSYGCSQGVIKILNVEGGTCLTRGAEYGFLVSSMVFSWIVAGMAFVLDRSKDDGERYDGSLYSAHLLDTTV